MNGRVRACFCTVVLLSALVVSCRRRAPKVRDESFLSAQQAVKVSNYVPAALERDSMGEFTMAAFVHSTFPSATEPREAIAVLRSADGGATWGEAARIPSFVTYGVWGYDLAVGKDDSLNLTWVAGVYDQASPVPFKAIMFSRSEDGGRSWTPPLQVSDVAEGQRRQPVLAVSGDSVHIAWLDSRANGAGQGGPSRPESVWMASSSNRGAGWSKNVGIEGDLRGKESSSGGPSLCVDADGALYCAYFSIRKQQGGRAVGGCWTARSSDGGRTFETSLHDTGPLGDLFLMQSDGKLYLAAVYIRGVKSISMQSPQTSQEIRFYESSDGGETWSRYRLIDDDPQHAHKSALRLARIGPDKLVACWDDDRGGVYMAASTDGGENWGKNVAVVGASSTGITPLDIATDPATGRFYLVAGDVRKGEGDATRLVEGEVEP